MGFYRRMLILVVRSRYCTCFGHGLFLFMSSFMCYARSVSAREKRLESKRTNVIYFHGHFHSPPFKRMRWTWALSQATALPDRSAATRGERRSSRHLGADNGLFASLVTSVRRCKEMQEIKRICSSPAGKHTQINSKHTKINSKHTQRNSEHTKSKNTLSLPLCAGAGRKGDDLG